MGVMSEVIKPYNEYAQMHYRLAYSTDTRKRVKATHYVVKSGDKILTNPLPIKLAQLKKNELINFGYKKYELRIVGL